MVFKPNGTEWRVHRAKRCAVSGYLAAGSNQQRMLLNHLGQAWCRKAITRSESRHSRQYDLVGYTRPDLMWWRPIVPWCAWWRRDRSASSRSSHPLGVYNASSPRTVDTTSSSHEPMPTVKLLACPHCDLAWLAPRAMMPSLLDQLTLHRECSAADAALCCSTPEALLSFAKRTGATAAAAAARGGSGGATPPTSKVARSYEELDMFGGQPPSGSLLRSSAACAVALHPNATTNDGMAHAAKQGVSKATVGWLRLLFNSDVAACKSALSTTAERISQSATVGGGAAEADARVASLLTKAAAAATAAADAPRALSTVPHRQLSEALPKSNTANAAPSAHQRYSADRYRSARRAVAPRLVLRLPSIPLRVTHGAVYVTGPSSLGQPARRREVRFFNPSLSPAPPGLCPRCAYVATLRGDVLHQCSASSPLYGEVGLPRTLPTNGFFKGTGETPPRPRVAQRPQPARQHCPPPAPRAYPTPLPMIYPLHTLPPRLPLASDALTLPMPSLFRCPHSSGGPTLPVPERHACARAQPSPCSMTRSVRSAGRGC